MASQTKDELIEEVERLKKTISDQTHLAEAVEAKDKEIARIQKSHQNEITNINNAHALAISELNENLARISKQVGIPNPSEAEKIKTLTSQVNGLGAFINRYKDVFKSFLKATQGSLENVIELEAIMFNSILQPPNGSK